MKLITKSVLGIITPVIIFTSGCGGSGSSDVQAPVQKPIYAYVTNGGGSSQISQYDVADDGSLSAMTTPAITGISPDPYDIIVDPSNQYAYAVAPGVSGQVYQFSIDSSTGELSSLTTASVSAEVDTRALTMSISGKFVYAVNASSDSVSQYSVGSDGALTPLGNATVATGNSPYRIAVHPSDKYAYVVNVSLSTISQYAIDQDSTSMTYGELKPMTTPTVSSSGSAPYNPFDIAVHPSGNYLYVVNRGNGNPGDISSTTPGSITQFTIAADGSLSQVTTATIAAGLSPTSIAVDPSGKYVYVTNAGDDTVSQYDVGTDGSLSAMTTPTIATGQWPYGIHIEATGNYVYVTNITSASISQYKIGTDGELSALMATPASTGTAARSIVTVVK